VPLVSQNGLKLGTLCVINSEPQHLTDEQSFALKVLAKQVIKLLDLRMTNRELKAQELKMKQQSEMQNRIISIIAHDVRSPLASLKQIIDFTKNDILSEDESKELMLMAETHLDSTLDLLSDLLEWGRMQVTKTIAETKPVNLFKMVQERFCQSYASAAMKDNELINLVDRELILNTDPNALQFIIRNLLSNAIKFTDNGAITIYAHREGDKVLISVSDTGIGMDDSVKTKLLDKDSKLSTLGTKQEKGTGLGLLFTKDFIDMLGGKMTIKSNKDKGTTFYIELKA
jgi:signal transduction histidine kinase